MKHIANEHLFHIPVMGTSFSIDSPLKVAQYGVASVISIGDDELCENMREFYSKKHGLDYTPIVKNYDRYRSDRITAYLDCVDTIVDMQIEEIKAQEFVPGSKLTKYFEMLPDSAESKILYKQMLESAGAEKSKLQGQLRERVLPGSIDVNIMTKIDRDNKSVENGEMLPAEYSDALAALKGYAESKLQSAIIFSAGFNRRLYAYLEKFKDFFPDENGNLKKKIVLKVSDFRSTLTQGKFLAKKGIWVSEHRIESGLNCGGHAFPQDGYVLGPILEEFKKRKEEVFSQLYDLCSSVLAKKGLNKFEGQPETMVTVQGGIGTANENEFLLRYYNVDRTGWASPFLLVPEATTVDPETRKMLAKAGKDELILSDQSPLGVPFNAVLHTPSEDQKWFRLMEGRPGSPCPKGHLVSNTEFTKIPICTASITYQKRKIAQLKEQVEDKEQLNAEIRKVATKSCLCEDLAAGALIEKNMDNNRPLMPAVCAGPNLAYFSRIMSLKEMVDHIYGRVSVLNDTYRSNMLVNEVSQYVKYFNKELKEAISPNPKQVEYFNKVKTNLSDAISYYLGILPSLKNESSDYVSRMNEELSSLSDELSELVQKFPTHFSAQAQTA